MRSTRVDARPGALRAVVGGAGVVARLAVTAPEGQTVAFAYADPTGGTVYENRNNLQSDFERMMREQDVVYCGGGNTANLIAILRAHRADEALRSAARGGTILAGVSAGALTQGGSSF